MKPRRISVILVLALVRLGGVARSQTATHVHGVGYPAIDVQAVQNAVDAYDRVHLHGTFDFADEVVHVTRSVEILGEGRDASGKYLTRIEGGGKGALRGVDNPDIEWAVKNIEFDGARDAIQTRTSKSLAVTGCRIRPNSAGGGSGIVLRGTDVTGSVTIEENDIDLSGVAAWGCGVFAQRIYADIKLTDNTVKNFFVTGLWINSAGKIVIKNNTITVGPAGPTRYRNGILVGSWYLPSGDRGNIEVTQNTITTGGHPKDNGITVEDFEQELRAVCKVEGNAITYIDDTPTGSGVLLLSHTSNWTFKDNTINGGGNELLAGIAMYPGIIDANGIQESNVFNTNAVFDAGFLISGVFIDSSAQANDNRFIDNEFKTICGDGFVIEGDHNQFCENQFERITGIGMILKGDHNSVRKNRFSDMGGLHIVDEGVDNEIVNSD